MGRIEYDPHQVETWFNRKKSIPSGQIEVGADPSTSSGQAKWCFTPLDKSRKINFPTEEAIQRGESWENRDLEQMGIKRHRKIKADANPYLAEYGTYFYNRRHDKESRFLAGLTSRQTRLALQQVKWTGGQVDKTCFRKCLSYVLGNSHAQFLEGMAGVSPPDHSVRYKIYVKKDYIWKYVIIFI